MNWQEVLSIVVPVVVSLGGFLGWIYHRLDKKFESVYRRFESVDRKFEQVLIEIKEIRTGLNRIEGAFYSKDCCMLKDDKHDRRAE